MRSFIFVFTFIFFASSYACTGIVLKSKNGIAITGRTLEFAKDLDSRLIAIPKGYSYVGTTPEGKNGVEWQAKYSIVGMSTLNYPHFAEGINDKGLGVGLFYFPEYASYPEYNPSESDEYLAPWEFGTWLLSNFASADEVKANADKVKVAPTVLSEWNIVIPVHFFVRDSSGKNLVLEYVGGKLHIYDDPIGILTNSPGFPWQVTNLQNYVNLSALDVPKIDLSGIEVGPVGAGSGLLGLPGDFTPPSRFIRATAFTQTSLPVESGDQGVTVAFHILDSFDIPKGTVYEKVPRKENPYEYTQWTSVSDLGNKRFYYCTYGDRRLRVVDLKAVKFEEGKMKTLSLSKTQDVKNISASLK